MALSSHSFSSLYRPPAREPRDLSADVGRLCDELTTVREERDHLKTGIHDLDREIGRLKDTLRATETLRVQGVNDLALVRRQLADAYDALSLCKVGRDGARESNHVLTKERDELKAQLSKARELRALAELENEGLRRQVQQLLDERENSAAVAEAERGRRIAADAGVKYREELHDMRTKLADAEACAKWGLNYVKDAARLNKLDRIATSNAAGFVLDIQRGPVRGVIDSIPEAF